MRPITTARLFIALLLVSSTSLQAQVTIGSGSAGSSGTGTGTTISVGASTTLPAGSSPQITNSGTPGAAVFNFGIPVGKAGEPGTPGLTPTVSVGQVTTLAAGSSPTVTPTGSGSAIVLNFAFPVAPPAVSSTANTPYSGSALVVFDGNSVVQGIGSSAPAQNSDDFAGTGFAANTMRSLATQFPAATFTKKNFGVNGQTTQDMINDVATQVDPLYHASNYSPNILVAREISNHIASGVSAQAAYDLFVNYCQARRQRGWKVVILSLTTRNVAPGTMSLTEYNNRKDAVNALLKQNWTLYADGFADVSSLSLTFPDGIHTNDAGYVLIGNVVSAAVAKLLQNGGNPTSVYPVTFTTAPVTSTVTSATILTLSGTGANGSTNVVDTSPYSRSVTNNNVTISTAQAKFGGSSLFFNGSNTTYLEIPSSTDFDFGVNDFTMEVWFYATAWNTSGVNPFIVRSNGTNIQWTFNVRQSGASTALNIRMADNTGYLSPGPSNSTAAPAINSWHHYAVVSTAGARKLYIDGVLSATSTAFPSMETNTTSMPIRIGVLSGPDAIQGYGHFRIVKSALYTANFTPPASF
ncbi:LamG-like jellyroll fold domain-containing protein [Fibrella sp. ES10-3-2-2]|nr:hypothetical protein A6C57_00395 [Fibrella sp. ES10-3-2-2]